MWKIIRAEKPRALDIHLASPTFTAGTRALLKFMKPTTLNLSNGLRLIQTSGLLLAIWISSTLISSIKILRLTISAPTSGTTSKLNSTVTKLALQIYSISECKTIKYPLLLTGYHNPTSTLLCKNMASTTLLP